MELKINSPKYGERIVLIDDEDYERISKYKWHLGYEKNVDNFYILSNPIINKKQVTLRLHRLIMNAPKNLFVDHKNGDTTDNRKCNLRLCTRSQNNMNSKKPINGTTSKYKGVYLKGNKYAALVGSKKDRKYLGVFNTEIEAAIAYNKKAVELFGEFAKLNEVSI